MIAPEHAAAAVIAAFLILCVLCALVDHFRPEQPMHTRRATSNRKAGRVSTW